MEQFNLEKWLKDKSRKVVTRDGKSVRIVCWDSPNKTFPIVGFIGDNPTVFVWDNYGYSHAGHVESKNDLFFADEEENLSEDEKIRKDIVAAVETSDDITQGRKEEIYAWLKKQGTPQVRTDIEWVNAIDDACNKRYSEEYSKGEYCHEQSFKWGFQEGVDWLEKQNEQKTIDDEELSILATTKAYDAYPISKTNMYNNEWNAKRVGYYQGYEQALKDNKFKKTIDWGEFDNDMITSINCLTKQGRHLEEEHLNWINSLKSKTYQVWSKDDENAIKTCIYAINYTFKDDDNPHKLGMEDWLKSLKNRVQPQQQVWSKDDEKIINDAIWLIEHYATDGHKKLLREQTIDKLKSLKPNNWKPSEEQMKVLEEVKKCGALYYNQKQVLESLYEELKNL